MRNSTILFSVETRFKDRFYCCLESLKGNYKFLLVFMMFMGSFMQGVSAQGTLVPSCNLIGPLEACAVADPNDTSGDFIINIEVARSGVPNLLDANHNLNFVYSFPSNTSGAFIRSYGPVVYNSLTNRTTQSLVVFPGSNTPEFNLQLNATNTTSSPATVCECSKSVSVSKVAVTSSFLPIACFGQTTTLTAVGQFSDIGQYTYTLLPSGPSNNDGIFTGLAGSEAGITYTVVCESAEGCTATTSQTITQPAYNPVVLTCPTATTTAACLTQQQVNALFNSWLASFSSSGGTSPVITRSPAEPAAPNACGGTITVTWTGTERCATEPVTCSSTFTVPTPPAVNVNGPANSTTNACTYADQAAANAAFASWLAQFTATGGCAPTGSYGQPVAPPYCGGTIDVTYNVTDRCYPGSSITRTFTITPAPAVVANGPANATSNACTYADQAAANAAFNAWLTGFTVSGGCAPVGNYGQPVAPPYCGGTTTVAYVVTDKCYQGTTITRTFTITPAPQVLINASANATSNACSYADQDAANAAFNAWIAGFSVSGGCAPVGSFGEGTPVAPPYCGGTTTVVYTVTDKCFENQVFTRTFTITPAPAVVPSAPVNATASACAYPNQDAVNAAFNAWLAQFSVTGGCAPSGSFGEIRPTAPNACGGTTTVLYTITDKCYQGLTIERTFTITPAPTVEVSGPQNSTTNACIYADQAAANAAFNAWLAQFTVSGGCAPSGSYGQPVAPPYCGGTIDVSYTVTDRCYDPTTITRTFTITPAPAVNVNGPANMSTNACVYADQAAADAAFAAWLTGFTVSGGCAPTGTYGQPVAPPYCGGTIDVTYRVSDKCYDGTSITRTFTITPAPQVLINAPQASVTNACSYADQAAADAAFAAWLQGFSVSGGCAPSGSYGEPVAPPYCGGTTSVTYRVTDKCYEGASITRVFIITPAPTVNVSGPENATSNACSYADQAAADAAFNAWLAGFTVTGGCAPSGSYGQPVAPPYCGGTVSVTYTVTDKCYQGSSITRTFTITAAPAVNVTTAQNSTSSTCAYADQAAANAAFAAWLAQFTVSGGCAPRGSFGEGTPQAPLYCGGFTTVTYTVTDKCYETTTHTATFTITPAPGVNVTTPQNSTTSACIYADQAAANAAFAAWLTGFTVSGGCAPSGSYGQPVAPPACGGTVTVNYTVTDKCYETTTHTATFTITAAPEVSLHGPANATSNACSYADQAAANAAFNAWLAGFTVSGGCAPTGSYGEPVAPPYCGGTTTVTYRVSDRCYEGSSVSATFTITPAPAVVINVPPSSTTSASAYVDQAAANAAFAAWLAQFSVSGGCAPSGSYGQPQAPLYCGGTVTVNYTVTDKCYETTTQSSTFTITPVEPPVIGAPVDTTTGACAYADQAAVNAAYAAWLAQFTVSGGINPTGSFGEGGAPNAPNACGGTVTVTYTVTDRCYEPIVITRTFTITPAPQVNVNGPENSTTNACAYADQAAANAAFQAWLSQFSVSGGCAPIGVLAVLGASPTAPINAPAYCGGTITVSYSVIDKCYQGAFIVRTFTITPPPAVNVTTAQNSTTSACVYADQAAADAAFAAWLQGFSVSGGCAPTGSFGEGQPQAPNACGGSTTVIYTVRDKCYETTTHTAIFTITAPPAVTFTTPENSTTNACSYADQAAANAAFNAWLAGFTVSGGCAPTGSYGEPQAPAYCGGTVTVNYSITDKCYEGSRHSATFTITGAPAVSVNGPANATSNACSYADQAAANAAFNAWLAGFTVSGGCAPTGSYGQPVAPPYCGGTVEVTYRVSDKCYEGSSITRTFTITAAPAVVVNGPANSTTGACSYANQAAATAAFNAWLAQFTVSGGCAPTGSYGQPQAPNVCGGTVSVTYTVNDKCYQGTSITRTFTITPVAEVVFTCGTNVTVPACSTQAQVNAAYAAFLASASASGGCANGTITNNAPAQAPSICGGSVTVTWTYTVTGCGTTQTCTRTFTVAAPAPVVLTCGSNVTLPSCSTQAQVNAAWTAFLNSTTATGGCGGVLTRTNCSAPSLCGGYVDVTWTYTVSTCGQQSGCGSNSNSVHCTKRFTIEAPAQVAIHCGSNVTVPACSSQADVNAAWTAFLASTTATGGCGGVLTNNGTTPPSLCGGYKDVTWTYTVASCGTQSGCGSSNNVTCTKRFTVAAPAQVVFNCGTNVTVAACKTQAQVNAAYAAFIASTTASGGCGGVLTNNAPAQAPNACGGYVDVTWTYTVASCATQSGCGANNSLTCTKRFTVTPTTEIVFNCGTNVTVPACSTQTQLNTAWNAFLASTTASGGCNGVLTRSTCNAPSLCGGSVDVTWTYTAGSCGGQTQTRTCTKTFTVAAPPQVVFNCGQNVTVPACSTQAEITAAWNAFLASTTASGGCNGVLTRSSCTMPNACGGYVDVTWTYTVSTCGQQSGCGSNTNSVSCTKRFTVATPTPATLNCASNVTMPSCSTQAEIDAAWSAFLASTTVSGGCSSGTLTNNAPTVAPGTCGGYVDVTWTYRTNTYCNTTVTCGGQSTTTGTIQCTKRFTVAAPTAATLTCASNVTVPACSTQAQVDAAWTAFLNSASISGGCIGGTLTNNAPTVPPATCGGYVDVTWTYRSNNGCQQVSCGGSYGSNGTVTCTKRFTVASPSVTINVSNNVTVASCSTQAQINSAWTAFLNSGSLSGQCAGATLTNNAPTVPPSQCGGYVDVTWTYRSNTSCTQVVTCGGSSSQGSTYTVTRRFTVATPSGATVNPGSNVTIPSCKTQAYVDAAWTSFLASTTFSGGCSGGTLTNNAPTSAPSACGGWVDVTWTYRSNSQCGSTTITCGGQSTTASTYTVTRRFTVTAGGGVNVSGPSNVSYVNTSFNSQYAVNNAFACWLAQFTTVSSGCGSTAVFSGDPRVAPSWSNGGTVRVTYSISGNCNSDSVCATFTITRGGATCKVDTVADVKSPMVVKAYPNPFSENFNLDMTTSSVAKVGVAIYDMTGKLIEQREVNSDEVSGLQVGNNFPSGVYNVIVTQGEEVKTLRVIKR